MDAYKSWVRRNRLWVSSFENLLNTMTWFLPERFANSELSPEAASTALRLVTVMNQHIIETDPSSGGQVQGQVVGPRPMAQQASGEESFPWALCLSFMKEVEVLTEMVAEHYLGADKKWGPLASVEAIKALVRLIILQKSGYRMLLDGGESKNVADGEAERAVSQGHEEGPGPGRPWQQQQQQQNRLSRESSGGGIYPRSLERRAMQAMHRFNENVAGSSRPSWLQQPQQQSFQDSRAQESLAYVPRPLTLEEKPETSITRAFVVGEVLATIRPLFYVLLVWRYGLKSWRPWVAALAVDVTAMFLVSSSTSSPSQESQGLSGPENRQQLSNEEARELRRRKLRWALYAMRNPFFDRYVRHPVEAVEKAWSPVPLLGPLGGKAVDLLFGLQQYYTYTAAS